MFIMVVSNFNAFIIKCLESCKDSFYCWFSYHITNLKYILQRSKSETGYIKEPNTFTPFVRTDIFLPLSFKVCAGVSNNSSVNIELPLILSSQKNYSCAFFNYVKTFSYVNM